MILTVTYSDLAGYVRVIRFMPYQFSDAYRELCLQAKRQELSVGEIGWALKQLHELRVDIEERDAKLS